MSSLSRKNSTAARTTRVLTAVTAVLALGACAIANAAPTTTAPSVTVRYDDLNLAGDSGTRVLYARIVAAARQVCAAPDIRDLGALAAARDCADHAIAQAVSDVHNPKLVAVFAASEPNG
jgi:UrcA family protein